MKTRRRGESRRGCELIVADRSADRRVRTGGAVGEYFAEKAVCSTILRSSVNSAFQGTVNEGDRIQSPAGAGVQALESVWLRECGRAYSSSAAERRQPGAGGGAPRPKSTDPQNPAAAAPAKCRFKERGAPPPRLIFLDSAKPGGGPPGTGLPLLRSFSNGVLDSNHRAHQDADARERTILHQHAKPDTLFSRPSAAHTPIFLPSNFFASLFRS
jgi:hypothetical protein